MQSFIERRGSVVFPAITGQRVYMREFRPRAGLPVDLRQWQPTVDAMLRGIDTDGVAYLMVDQGFVRSGELLRRPGVHVDGYWMPGLSCHGGGGNGGHGVPAPKDWRNPSSGGHMPPYQSHRSPDELPSGHRTPGRHGHSGSAKEAIILASDIVGCIGYAGAYEANYGEGGDASMVDLAPLSRVNLSAGHAWAGNVGFLHESIPMERDCYRTVVRLNVPGWEPAP